MTPEQVAAIRAYNQAITDLMCGNGDRAQNLQALSLAMTRVQMAVLQEHDRYLLTLLDAAPTRQNNLPNIL